jgi:hypothetical protein
MKKYKESEKILDLRKAIDDNKRVNAVQFASFSPTDGLILYRTSTVHDNIMRSWVGSSDSGNYIVKSRKVSGNINDVVKLMHNDAIFRRAIIALPDALEQLKCLLGLLDRHMWHTCMLAFILERGNQRKKQEDKVILYVSDIFEHYSKIEEHMDDIQSYITVWSKEFLQDFPSKL